MPKRAAADGPHSPDTVPLGKAEERKASTAPKGYNEAPPWPQGHRASLVHERPDPLRRLLQRLLLDWTVRHTLVFSLVGGLSLAAACAADDWFERPTGTLRAPSGVTVYGLRRQGGLGEDAVSYATLTARMCDAERGEKYLHAALVSKAGQREVERVQQERRPNQRPEPVNTLPDGSSPQHAGVTRLRAARCAFYGALEESSRRAMWGLLAAWALWGFGLLAALTWMCSTACSLRTASAFFFSAAGVLVVIWWLREAATQKALRTMREELHQLGSNESIAVAALARGLQKLYLPGIDRAFSTTGTWLSSFAFVVTGFVALSDDLGRMFRPVGSKAVGCCEGCCHRLQPLGKLFEKHIVGYDDFDKKNETYVNKHERLGQPIGCCTGSRTCNRTLSNLRDMYKHQVRAFESMGFMHSLVSIAEKEALDKHGVKDQMAQNFLAWRLSVLVLTATCGCAVLILRPLVALLEDFALFHAKKDAASRRPDWDNLSYANYSAAMAEKVLAVVEYKVTEGDMYIELAHYSAELFAVIMCLLGLSCWVYFGTSRKYVVRGWLLLLFSPFAITLIPIKTLVHLDAVGPVLDEWVINTMDHFNLGDKIEKCRQFIESEDTVKARVQSMEKMCAKVDQYDGSWAIWLGGIDLDEARRSCEAFRDAVRKGYVDKALKSVEKVCGQLNAGFGFSSDAEARSLLAVVKGRILVYMEVYLSARCALGAYKMMVPAALAFGPGFVRAAWKLKLLFPLARLPGTLVILLPAMYCPLLWMTYQFFFQILASWTLLLGLIVISFAPMIYSLVGTIFDLQNPVLSRSRLARILRHGRFWRIWVQRIGYVLIIVWFVLVERGIMNFMDDKTDSEEERQFKRDLFNSLRQRQIRWLLVPMQPVLFILSWAFKFFFTKAAGMDFLIQQLASDYAFEKCVEVVANIPDEDLQDPDKAPEALEGVPVPERIAETRQLEVDRKRIGEALVKMTLHELAEPRESEDGQEVLEAQQLDADMAFQRFAPELAGMAQMQYVAQNPFFQNWCPQYYPPQPYAMSAYGVESAGPGPAAYGAPVPPSWAGTASYYGNPGAPSAVELTSPAQWGGQWSAPQGLPPQSRGPGAAPLRPAF